MQDAKPVITSLLETFAAGSRQPVLIAAGSTGLDTWHGERLGSAIAVFAEELRRAGPRAGEPVALLAPPGPDWVVAYFAILLGGGIAVPIDHGVDDAEADRFMTAAGCRAAIAAPARVEPLRRQVREGLPVIAARIGEHAGTPGRPPAEAPPLSAPASLLLTSGTTGTPKVVPLTHGQLTHNVRALVAENLVSRGERVLLPLPLHHVYPFTAGLLTTLASGAAVVFPEGMSGPQIIEALQKARPQVMVGVPRLYESLIAGVEARVAARGRVARSLFRLLLQLSIAIRRYTGMRMGRLLFRPLHRYVGARLRTLGCGGARLDPDTWWRLEGLGWEVLTGYGLTETAPVVTFNPRGRARVGTEGRALPGVEVRIAAEPGAEQGEIQVRGPNVFTGYRENPERTRAAFTPDGWFRTGDLGSLDRDGYLRVAGRSDELIVLPDGKKVFPERIERVYGESPWIRELAILPSGGRLVALVVPDTEALRARGTARLATVINEDLEMRGRRLARYERLSGTVFTVQPLPRTRLGKLRRHLLADLHAAAREGQSPAADGPTATVPSGLTPRQTRLWEWLRRRYPDRRMTPDSSLQLDLGVDSLDWVNLSLEWQESFGIRLTETMLSRIITVGDLLAAVEEAERLAPEAAAAAARTAADLLEPRGRVLEAAAEALFILNRLLMKLVFRVRASGLEHLPREGPLLIAPNHTSYLDPFVIAAVLPWETVRNTWWAAWSGILFTGPVTRALSRIIQAFPVDPDRSPAAGIMVAADLLGQHRMVVWFPEGRRSPGGELLPLQAGVGLLLKRSGAPVLPVAIRGAFQALPRDRLLPRPAVITVTFGAPAQAAALDAEGNGADTETRVTTALAARLGALQRAAGGNGSGSA